MTSWPGTIRRWLGTLGAAALAATIARVGCVPAYARVDLVDAGIGSPQILEVELVDPYLSLDLLPSATERLVAALGEAPAGGRGTRREPRPD